jgi:peptidoglycan/xylan/chitin deacetylase (PgdA/CDA1 family)
MQHSAHNQCVKRILVLAAAVAALAVAAPASAQALPVTYRVDTRDPVVFITIDDGIVTPQAGLDYVEKHRIPITSFLTSSQVTDSKVRYFERISRWGSVQNHTTTHASLATSDAGLIKSQVCPVQVDFRRTFGTKPWMLRPPYGAGPDGRALHDVVRRCHITDIVMWDTVVEQGRITYRYGDGLKPGSVILLHYSANLAADLKVAVSTARARGLRPANLADYLAAPVKR